MSHSEKTKTGIAKARAAGVKWGRHGSILAESNKDAAQEFAENLRPLILDLMLSAGSAKGRGLTALAEKLNSLGVPTTQAGKWYSATVHRLMRRLEPSLSKSFKIIDDANSEKFKKGEDFTLGIVGHSRHAEKET